MAKGTKQSKRKKLEVERAESVRKENKMIRTKMTELLGIEYPIFLGAMAWITTAGLVAAVTNAGGARVLGSGGRDHT